MFKSFCHLASEDTTLVEEVDSLIHTVCFKASVPCLRVRQHPTEGRSSEVLQRKTSAQTPIRRVQAVASFPKSCRTSTPSMERPTSAVVASPPSTLAQLIPRTNCLGETGKTKNIKKWNHLNKKKRPFLEELKNDLHKEHAIRMSTY